MDRCDYCKKEGQNMIDINNFVVKYESWEAYNCCSKECAKKRANQDGIDDEEIISIE